MHPVMHKLTCRLDYRIELRIGTEIVRLERKPNDLFSEFELRGVLASVLMCDAPGYILYLSICVRH